MGSIIKKKIKNQTYYYYTESKRIEGKPKLVNQKYLGSAEKLLKIVLSSELPLQETVLYSDITEFGAVAMLYDIADRLGIIGEIDSVIHKRNQGVSVGTYILTAAINRAVAPLSKNGLKDWYSNTILSRILGIKQSAFTPQNFWNNTAISEAELDEIENRILSKVISKYDIDTTHLIYDATNFFTYIDTNQDSELAQRGHSKEKRNDLRIVGLSLMVEPEFSIPLLHESYPGNCSDSKEFTIMMDKLKNRYQRITGNLADVSVVFDRGNNSELNIELLESEPLPLHYVGGLKKNQLPNLFAISKDKYQSLEGESLCACTAYRMNAKVFGKDVIAVIVYNPELEKGQMQGILINRKKTREKLMEIQQRLMKRANGEIVRGKQPTRTSIESRVLDILKIEYMRDIFSYEIIDKEGKLFLTFGDSEAVLEKIRYEQLGKTALFTDRDDLSNEEIIHAYRSAWHVESAFKQMKNTDHLRVRPIFHWTDEKIRVHIFICVLAYRLCCLLVKELSTLVLHKSINRLIDEMSGIKKTCTFFGSPDNPEKVETLTLGSDIAQQIEAVFRLKEKCS